MQCPSCGAENQNGNFCASCGAALDVSCAACGADVPAGASYCTACGEPVAGAAAGEPGSRAPWIIAAVSVAIVAALVLAFLPGGQVRTPAPPSGSAPFMDGGGAPGGDAGGMGLSGDMRTNADRLFNRIMAAAEQGNQGEVAQFMPMAIEAYGMVSDLDNDGLYHLGLLHLTAGSYDRALETAGRILDDEPRHLLALAVAAEASTAAGDSAGATAYWERFLDAYEAEAARPIPEYVDHQPMLPEYRRLAREATGR